MPRYIVAVQDDGGWRDYTEVDCDDQEAARSYVERVIGELQQDGCDDKVMITVELEQPLFSLPIPRSRWR